MAVFAILSRNGVDVGPAVQREFPDSHYIWSAQVAFVTSSGAAREINERLGVTRKGPDGAIINGLGEVIISEMLPNYWGWTDQAVWPWLRASFEGGK